MCCWLEIQLNMRSSVMLTGQAEGTRALPEAEKCTVPCRRPQTGTANWSSG